MADSRIRVGNVEVLLCSDGNLESPLEAVFPTVSLEEMAPLQSALP